MGQPAHELRQYVRQFGLTMRSANFALYGDMSRRVLAVLDTVSPHVEAYSIDESFILLPDRPESFDVARRLRERVQRWTGIANSIGLGPTKTLAKLANKLAKRGAGLVDLNGESSRAESLATYPVEDVWGVGPKLTAKLTDMGITTAAQLRDAPPDLVLARFGVCLARTQRELQGFSCLALEEMEPDRQQIMVSRSFGQRVIEHEAVAQAICTFAVRACEKLRARQLAAGAVWIFAGTDPFRPELPQHHPSRAIPLSFATQDTALVLGAIRQLLANFLRPGYAYKRAGVGLLDLARPEDLQGDLFGPALRGNQALMTTLDRINKRFGRGTAGFAASGWQASPAWGMRQKNLSPCYTTRWSDVPIAHC
jgi:DNA polymerase V